MRRLFLILAGLIVLESATLRRPRGHRLRPSRVYDGVSPEAHADWAVMVRGEKIEAVGPSKDVTVPRFARVIDLPGLTVAYRADRCTYTCAIAPV